MPENARKLREIFLAHDALLIASPENNSSLTALLKNTIDWLSRDVGDGKGDASGLAPWRGKVAGLMAASPGAFGGVRALPHLRQVLSALGVTVLGSQVAVPKADDAFGADGSIADERVARSVRALAAAVADLARRSRDSPPIARCKYHWMRTGDSPETGRILHRMEADVARKGRCRALVHPETDGVPEARE